MCKLMVGVLLICALGGAVYAAPSFLSTSGNILTPDDTLLAPGGFSANFHAIHLDAADTTPSVLGANIGVTPFLELGVARFDPDNGDEETIINGKYLVSAETATRPSILIGAVDLTGELPSDGDPGFYVLLSKNLTRVASEVAGQPSRPIRGHLGVGTGIYDGLFGSLDWTLSDRLSLMAEFVNGDASFVDESAFNVGIRFALTSELRGDLALIDGDDFGFGISFTKAGM